VTGVKTTPLLSVVGLDLAGALLDALAETKEHGLSTTGAPEMLTATWAPARSNTYVYGSGSIRVGLDLIATSTVADAIALRQERYLGRVFSEAERRDCLGAHEARAAYFAARFAAKEATIKMLRPEDEVIDWRSIEVVREPSGAPSIRLTGDAEAIARRIDLQEISVTLVHEGEFAAALVIGRCGKALG
jgi:holo-[acyl-carrier protein] synthase